MWNLISSALEGSALDLQEAPDLFLSDVLMDVINKDTIPGQGWGLLGHLAF